MIIKSESLGYILWFKLSKILSDIIVGENPLWRILLLIIITMTIFIVANIY